MAGCPITGMGANKGQDQVKGSGGAPFKSSGSGGGCPVTGAGFNQTTRPNLAQGTKNKDWWPDLLDLKILAQNNERVNPYGKDFSYAEALKNLDVKQLKEDMYKLMTESQDWWPADYGHYGPLFIRLAWHSAGTYRSHDGRGGSSDGTIRFPPLGAWPDNANLDKAKRLLWPIKKKYGKSLSWADLFVLAGNTAMESMGLKMYGFAFGREDVWQPQEDVYWGEEKTWLGDERYSGEEGERHLDEPLAAVQMGLIYVNPEGPNGEPMPKESAKDVRETFTRMGMTDEETVALIAGGHTFGKMHGAKGPQGVEPPAAPIEQQGLGWKNAGGPNTVTSGLEGAWSPNPTKWDMGFLTVLMTYEWDLAKSPAGKYIWVAQDVAPEHMIEDAFDPDKKHAPVMNTADMGLKFDPIYGEICKDFLANPQKFEDAFTRAWFKLTHRDMGPKKLYLGPEVPAEDLIWQDPLPQEKHELSDADVTLLKDKLANSDLTVSQLIGIAWASASTFRGSDKRGGANGARIRLEPQRSWHVNKPLDLDTNLPKYEAIQKEFEASGKKVSIADLIVLGGAVGIELAAKKAGKELTVPFTSGRVDATQEQTGEANFKYLEPIYDGFRNYSKFFFNTSVEYLLLDKSQLLGLTAPQMTVLLGGLRVLGNNYEGEHGVFTDKKETLTNDFFVNLLDMSTEWAPTDESSRYFIGKCRQSGKRKYDATRVDLIFGHNDELRALAEVYALDDSKDKFYEDFVAAWNHVMNNDLF